MVALETPNTDINWKAKDFNLKSVDNKYYNLEDLKGKNGTAIMFICNHCPFVKPIIDNIVRDANELKEYGINFIAIMSNDPNLYEEDSFSNMQNIAKEKNFPFQYLFDETQNIAKIYDAICTPDIFGFNSNLELQYRGRFDDSKMDKKLESTRDLFHAMLEIAKNGKFTGQIKQSIGCSIKWKD